VAFAGLSLALNDPRDYDVPFVALMSLVPALCTVPYLTLATRKPYAAVVFAVALVAALKLLGCVIVVLTYGWDASERGYTRMPWTDPNLLVWAFWGLTGVYSAVLYALGVQKYQSLRNDQISSCGLASDLTPGVIDEAAVCRIDRLGNQTSDVPTGGRRGQRTAIPPKKGDPVLDDLA
jgi:hypothetical protein